MWPSLDHGVECVSRAQSRRHLSMSDQLVVLCDGSTLHATLNDLLSRLQLPLRRYHAVEGAHERYGNALVIVTDCLCRPKLPSATDVSQPIATHQVVVANVRPVPGLNVKRLAESDEERALRLSGANVRCCVTQDDVGHWKLQLSQRLRWRLGAPFVARNEPHAGDVNSWREATLSLAN